MDSVCTKYAAFVRELQEFVALMCQRFKKDAPAKLRDVALVCTVLRSDEKSCNYVKYVMTLVFSNAGRYVNEEHLDWFTEQSVRLQQMMNNVTPGDGGCSEEVQILSPGISGVNTGVKPGHSEVLVKLGEVIKELQ